MKELQLEINSKYVKDDVKEGKIGSGIMITPSIGCEDYWKYRVMLSEAQGIIGFPKFNTIGIGFLEEKYSWNTNLPFILSAEEIYEHIRLNKKDKNISKTNCIIAIQMIQIEILKEVEK